MNLFTEDEISTAFNNDFYKRRVDAEKIFNLINVYKEGAIFSINAPWGAGKTWFIRNFIKKYENDIEFINYNAWKDEVKNDPFGSFLMAIYTHILNHDEDAQAKEDRERAITSFKKIAKHLIPVATKLVFGLKLDIDQAGALVHSAMDSISGISTEIFEEYREQEKNEEDFKQMLSGFILKKTRLDENSHKPFVIFIDELDRCSPNYVIHFLEVMKHYFEIDNAVFILTIDKDKLLGSIEHHYGEKINANVYLSKFINLQYKLSCVFHDREINNLHAILQGHEVFKTEYFKTESIEIIKLLSLNYSITIRDIERLNLIYNYIYNNRSADLFRLEATRQYAFYNFFIKYKDIHTFKQLTKDYNNYDVIISHFSSLYNTALNNLQQSGETIIKIASMYLVLYIKDIETLIVDEIPRSKNKDSEFLKGIVMPVIRIINNNNFTLEELKQQLNFDEIEI